MHIAVLCDNSLKKDQTFTLLMTVEVSNHLRGENVSFQETEVTGISLRCRPFGGRTLRIGTDLRQPRNTFQMREQPAWLPQLTSPHAQDPRLILLTGIQSGGILPQLWHVSVKPGSLSTSCLPLPTPPLFPSSDTSLKICSTNLDLAELNPWGPEFWTSFEVIPMSMAPRDQSLNSKGLSHTEETGDQTP